MICACENCGRREHIDMLDAKPTHLAGPGNWLVRLFPRRRLRALWDAADAGHDFDRLECRRCYGPGYASNV